MKLCPIKFGLAAGTTAALFMTLTKLFWRFFLCKQLSMMGVMPGGMMKDMAGKMGAGEFNACSLMGWQYMLFGIIATFVMTFAMGWFFAWFYNMLMCKCK